MAVYVLLDCDQTLINEVSWDIMCSVMKLPTNDYYDRYMKAESLDQRAKIAEEWAKHEIGMIEGYSSKSLDVMMESVSLAEGTKEFIDYCKSKGYRTGIVSCGFTPIVRRIADELEIDVYVEFKIENSSFPGRLCLEKAVSDRDKLEYVRKLKAEGHEVVYVGDGVNDLPAMELADLSLLVHSPEVPDLRKALELLKQAGY